MTCYCIVCGDKMVEERPGVRTCDCPSRGYQSKLTPLAPRLQPELRPPIDCFGLRHAVVGFCLLVVIAIYILESFFPS